MADVPPAATTPAATPATPRIPRDQRTQILLATTSRANPAAAFGPLFRALVKTLTATFQRSVERMLIFAAVGFALGWLYNFVVMSVAYNGFGKVPPGGPATGTGNEPIGTLFSFVVATLIFAIYSHRRRVGKERFWESVRAFPKSVRTLCEEDREAAAAHFLWALAGAMLVSYVLGPWLVGALAVGFLVGMVSIFRSLFTGLVMIAWQATIRKLRPDRHRPPPPRAMVVGSLGAMSALVVGFFAPDANIRLLLALGAAGLAYMLGRRQITAGHAAAIGLLVLAVAVGMHDVIAHASDGGFSECGGNLIGCPGLDGDMTQSLWGGTGAGLGGVLGALLGNPDGQWPPPDKGGDDGKGKCPACERQAATQYHGAVKAWLDAHPGATWNDFMAQRIAHSQAEAQALNDRLERLHTDVVKLEGQADRMIQTFDDAEKPPVPLDQMTEQQRNQMMKQAVQNFHTAYPKAQSVDQFNQAFGYVNRNPHTDAGQLAAGIIADSFNQALPTFGQVASDAAGGAWEITKTVFSPEFASALGQDIAQGDWMERVAAPFKAVTKYALDTDWTQLQADAGSFAGATSKVTQAAWTQFGNAMESFDRAANAGDTKSIAHVIDTIGANLALQELMGFAVAKTGAFASASFLKMTGQVTQTAEALGETGAALKTGQALGSAEHGVADAGTAVDSVPHPAGEPMPMPGDPAPVGAPVAEPVPGSAIPPEGIPLDTPEKRAAAGFSEQASQGFQEQVDKAGLRLQMQKRSTDALAQEGSAYMKSQGAKDMKSIVALDHDLGYTGPPTSDGLLAFYEPVEPVGALPGSDLQNRYDTVRKLYDLVPGATYEEKLVSLAGTKRHPNMLEVWQAGKKTDIPIQFDRDGVLRNAMTGRPITGDYDGWAVVSGDGTRRLGFDATGRKLADVSVASAERRAKVNLVRSLVDDSRMNLQHAPCSSDWGPLPALMAGEDGAQFGCKYVTIGKNILRNVAKDGVVEFRPGEPHPFLSRPAGMPPAGAAADAAADVGTSAGAAPVPDPAGVPTPEPSAAPESAPGSPMPDVGAPAIDPSPAAPESAGPPGGPPMAPVADPGSAPPQDPTGTP